jgi:hypothetical protein
VRYLYQLVYDDHRNLFILYDRDDTTVILVAYQTLESIDLLYSLALYHLDCRERGEKGERGVVFQILDKKYLKEKYERTIRDLAILCEDPRCVMLHGPSNVILTSMSSGSCVDMIPFRKNKEFLVGGEIVVDPAKTSDTAYHRYFTLMLTQSGIVHVDVLPLRYLEETEIRSKSTLTPSGDNSSKPVSTKSSVKKKLEQLIFFSSEQNPIDYVLTEQEYDDLADAIEELLREILDSTSDYIDPALDLVDYFALRLRYVGELMKFLNLSNTIASLSIDQRFYIAEHTEKLMVCSEIWNFASKALSQGAMDDFFLITLRHALEGHYRSHKYPIRDDIVRHFFRYHVTDTFELFNELLNQLLTKIQAPMLPSFDSRILSDTCHFFTQLVSTILEYRNSSALLLAIIDAPSPKWERWTSQKSFLGHTKILLELVYAKIAMYEPSSISTTITTTITTGDNKSSLSSVLIWWNIYISLADCLFFTTTERLTYLRESHPVDDGDIMNDQEWSIRHRTQIVYTLIDHSQTQAAFQLAEKYQDFRSLVEACYHSWTDSDDELHAKLEYYVNQFGESCLKVLFGWYLETGRFKELVSQPEKYLPVLQVFLAKEKKLDLLWIIDIFTHQYEDAAKILLILSMSIGHIEHQMTVLSLAKLSVLTTMIPSESNIQNATLLNTIEDRLDVGQIQLHKINELLALLAKLSIDPKLCPVDDQYELLRKHQIKPLLATISRAGLDYFGYIVRKLLSYKVVSPEELMDYLTMTSYQPDDRAMISNYILALETYLKTFHVSPMIRKFKSLLLCFFYTLFFSCIATF